MMEIFLVVLLLSVSAVLTGVEAAFLVVSDIRVKTLMHRGDRRALLLHELRSNMHRLLGVILLVQVICDVAASALATVAATKAFGHAGIGVATGVMTVLVLIFGQLVPKTLAARQPERWSLYMAKPMTWLVWLLGPPLVVVEKIVKLVLHREVRFDTEHVISEEEIKTMASLGAEAGTVETEEAEMIKRVFLFNDINASDVMTPKENVVFLDGAHTLAEAMPIIDSNGYSRYPVFGRDKNDIIGIVHIKDVFRRHAENLCQSLGHLRLRDLAEPASFVPHKKHLDDLLRDMQKQHVHMAIVVNEFGSMDGVVTFEDLMEELVGEIADESDVDETTVKRVDRLNIVVHGDAEIKDINRFFNSRLEGPPFKSIAWLVLKELGTLPEKGQRVQLGSQMTATVEEIINHRINRIRLTKTEAEPNPTDDAAR
ncbi:MAG: hemolysin family protein [Patescibacteria group bacterium]|nr:hemolysin family protein [Patescibacteria group bacterium]